MTGLSKYQAIFQQFSFCILEEIFFNIRTFLVPKPLLGNAPAGEVPRLPVTGDGPKPGLRAQTHSQAGAWERGKPGLGNEENEEKAA